MYAVIETGGKQYRVEVGTELEVELLDVEAGQSINLERILLVADGASAAIGRPVVENATVAADVLGQTRGAKVVSFKYRPKARRRVTKGHRQDLIRLRISDIVLNGKSAAAGVAAARAAADADRARAEEAAQQKAAADAALAAKLAEAAPKAAPKARAAKPAAAKPAAADKPLPRMRQATEEDMEALGAPRKTRSTKKDG
jgi:large subunit ribosomal protein L21